MRSVFFSSLHIPRHWLLPPQFDNQQTFISKTGICHHFKRFNWLCSFAQFSWLNWTLNYIQGISPHAWESPWQKEKHKQSNCWDLRLGTLLINCSSFGCKNNASSGSQQHSLTTRALVSSPGEISLRYWLCQSSRLQAGSGFAILISVFLGTIWKVHSCSVTGGKCYQCPVWRPLRSLSFNPFNTPTVQNILSSSSRCRMKAQ